jgi:predicted lipoprotein
VASAGDKALALGPALVVVIAVVVGCATLYPLAGCKIVYDDDQKKKGPSATSTDLHALDFDAAAWVGSVWSTKVAPHCTKDAVAVGPVRAALTKDVDEAGTKFGRRADTEGSPWTFTVKGTGKVVSVDTESRAGTIVVAVDAPSGPENVTLQIGPVVRGTAIRDSLPFFSFGDVNNQIQFAQVARALNDKAIATVQPKVDALKAPGTPIEFTGAMNVSSPEDGLVITPVALEPAGAK